MARTDRDILLKKFEQAKAQVEIGAKYQHTKSGGKYVVTDIVIRNSYSNS